MSNVKRRIAMKRLIQYTVVKFPQLKKVVNRLSKNKLRIQKDNTLSINNGLLKSSILEVKGKNNCIKVGHESKVYDCDIDTINGYNNKLIISNHVILSKTDIKMWGNNNILEIKDNTTFNKDCKIKIFEGTKVFIGKNCMISYDVDIRSSDGHPIFDQHNNRINKAEDIKIGNHVWIGSRVHILKGSKILNNSMVGAGSLVTKAFTESDVLIFGRPAIIKRDSIKWKRHL